MVQVSLAGIGFTVERFDPHLLHQCADMLSIDLLSIQLENGPKHSGTCKWQFGMEFVDLSHQTQILP